MHVTSALGSKAEDLVLLRRLLGREIRALHHIKGQASETNLQERLCRSHAATRREPQ
jgi:hypothetical protein